MSKYQCEYCNYDSNNKSNFIKHCKTKKHISMMERINEPNLYFQCKSCNYLTCNKNRIKLHSTNSSHPFLNYPIHLDSNKQSLLKCKHCKKEYKYSSGYYRHIKTCNNNEVAKLLKLATEMNSKLYKKINNLERKTLVNNTINNINTKVDIHVYLNNECKNAMNLSEFVETLNLSVDDLVYTKNNGYIKGITNIFVKNLNHLEPKERPIHSILDEQSHQFYIKDITGWECDKKEEKLDDTIETVSKKQFHKIKEWEASRPKWNESDHGINEYMKMVQSLMGGNTNSERRENKKKIKQDLKKTISPLSYTLK